MKFAKCFENVQAHFQKTKPTLKYIHAQSLFSTGRKCSAHCQTPTAMRCGMYVRRATANTQFTRWTIWHLITTYPFAQHSLCFKLPINVNRSLTMFLSKYDGNTNAQPPIYESRILCRHETTFTLSKNNAAADLEQTSHFCPMFSCLIKTLMHDMRLAIGNKLKTNYTHDLTSKKKGTAHSRTPSRSNKLLFPNSKKPYPGCHGEPSVCSCIPISFLTESRCVAIACVSLSVCVSVCACVCVCLFLFLSVCVWGDCSVSLCVFRSGSERVHVYLFVVCALVSVEVCVSIPVLALISAFNNFP